MPESSRFRTPFVSQCVHGPQTLRNFAWQHFYPDFTLIRIKSSQKTSLLITSEILGLFGNSVTAYKINLLHDRDKLREHIQTPLSLKRKAFPQLFSPFLKSKENFASFERKDQLHTSNILERIDSEKYSYLNARKLPFQNTLRESTCSRLPNSDEHFREALL